MPEMVVLYTRIRYFLLSNEVWEVRMNSHSEVQPADWATAWFIVFFCLSCKRIILYIFSQNLAKLRPFVTPYLIWIMYWRRTYWWFWKNLKSAIDFSGMRHFVLFHKSVNICFLSDATRGRNIGLSTQEASKEVWRRTERGNNPSSQEDHLPTSSTWSCFSYENSRNKTSIYHIRIGSEQSREGNRTWKEHLSCQSTEPALESTSGQHRK